MDKEIIILRCESYDNILEGLGYSIAKRINDIDNLHHIRWMLNTIPNLLRNGELEKANRWLGFTQGILCSRGYISSRDVDYNKPML